MKPLRPLALAAITLCTATISPVLAQTGDGAPGTTATTVTIMPSEAKAQVRLEFQGNWDYMWENDLLYRMGHHTVTDQGYTNGLRVTRNRPGLSRGPGNLGPALFDRVGQTLLGSDRPVVKGWSIGHSIYTPSYVGHSHLALDDRPYGAWLYGNYHLTSLRMSATDTAATRKQDGMSRLTVGIGLIGPGAGGERVQKAVHSITNSTTPMGWRFQLRNEGTLQLRYEKKMRPVYKQITPTVATDVLMHGGGDLGNAFTQAFLGGEVRLGYNLQRDFGGDIIAPTKRTVPPTGERQKTKNPFHIHLFAGTEGRAVARNVFLDGNTWTNSHSVNKRHFVHDFKAGLAVGKGKLRLTYTAVERSPEFRERSIRHAFSSLRLTCGTAF